MSEYSIKSKEEPSREEIWKLFDVISATYDKTNRWMTLGLDLYWRKKVSSFLPNKQEISLLDCATGTGDQIISLCKNNKNIKEAIGIDLSESMLAIGKRKLLKTPFKDKITLLSASALAIPFPEDKFNCVTLSFGIRNVTEVDLCLKEILRVLKTGGRVIILETSLPKSKILKSLHLFHIRKVLPFIGKLISKREDAYRYLNKTAETFPHGKEFCQVLQQAGFKHVANHPMTFGAVSIYVGEKEA